MIGEPQLSYRLSPWTLLGSLALGIPLVCISVRGQEEKPAAAVTPSPPEAGVASTPADAKEKLAETSKPEQAKSGDVADTESIAPKIKELGDAVRKRLTTYSDEETLTLKDGQTGRMQLQKNVAQVSELLID